MFAISLQGINEENRRTSLALKEVEFNTQILGGNLMRFFQRFPRINLLNPCKRGENVTGEGK